jgi:RNA polymerase sigma-70 factor (ECF subfamily)
MQTMFGGPATLLACDASDRARIEALVRRHFNLVWRYLRRLGLSDADAEDAAQHVFLLTSKKLARVEPERERSFLLGVAVRVAADARKARERRRAEPEAALERAQHPGPTPEQALEQQRACELLDRLLEEVDQEARAVFVLYEIEGLTLQEIACALKCPQGTVASRLRRGRTKFEAAVARHRAKLEKVAGQL